MKAKLPNLSNKKPISISFTNNKGGVGKTTIVINTAAALAKKGYKVLVIDNDPQANLTFGIGLEKTVDFQETIYTAVKEEKPLPFYQTAIQNLFITPCELSYGTLDVWFMAKPTGVSTLKKKLKNIDQFDFILIDNAPAVGAFMYNSIFATDHTIIVVEGNSLAVKGLEVVGNLLKDLEEDISNRLLGVIVNKINNYVVRKDTVKFLRENYNDATRDLVFNTSISQYVAIEESLAFQQTIFDYTSQNEGVNPKAVQEFEALTEELLQRLQIFDN